MKEAKNSIYDVSLSSRTWYEQDDDNDRVIFNQIREDCFKDPLIETRYLTTFKTYLSKDDLSKGTLRHLIVDLKKQETKLEFYKNKLKADKSRVDMIAKLKDYNFRAAYLPEVKPEHPLLSFLIVDNEKVLLGFYESEFKESNISKDKALYIDNKEVADLFYKYFELLWETATKFAHDSHNLKEISDSLTTQLKEIEKDECKYTT